MSLPLFPVFLDLRARRVLLVGGGPKALRQARHLLEAGADLAVAAPELTPKLARWAARGRLRHHPGEFEPRWLDGAWLVLVAEATAELARRVVAEAEARRIWVNVTDVAPMCSFQTPARIARGRVQIAVGSGGTAPALVRHVRERIEAALTPELGPLSEWLAARAGWLRTRCPDPVRRRQLLDALIDGPAAHAWRSGRPALAESALTAALAEIPAARGRVLLVGAGAGDAGLLSLRALRALQQADVILHDRLVDPAILDLARRDAERISVGKRAGDHHCSQERIHALMIDHARAGRVVMRLKGGDPFVFGRGGEELEALRAAGVDYEVVPGITAALACAAHAGIPLTHREHAQSVCFVTAHCRDSIDALDWAALGRARQTLVFYMGIGHLETVRDRLLAQGCAADTPCALIENGGRAQQRVLIEALARLPEPARALRFAAPALLIVGAVAALGRRLHWYAAAPLAAHAADAAHAA